MTTSKSAERRLQRLELSAARDGHHQVLLAQAHCPYHDRLESRGLTVLRRETGVVYRHDECGWTMISRDEALRLFKL